MLRLLLASLLAFAVLAIESTAPAFADDRVPCAEEAGAVKRMKKRDGSFDYPKSVSARAHLETGKRAFGVGNYDKAIESYTSAGLVDDAPLILYNLGQTYRAAKDYEKALRQYRLFLERGKPGREVRALVECHIRTMTEELQHAASTAPPTGPPPDPPPAAPVEKPTDPSPVSTTDDRPPSRFTSRRKIALVTGAVGVVLVAVGAGFHLNGRGLENDAAALCPMIECADADEANVLARRADTNYRNAAIGYGVGAAAIVGAAVLWFTGAPERTPTGRAVARPRVSPRFAGVDITVRF